jgi:uncharacterized protein YggU (UPF0235/DUF167 family)
VDNRANEQLIGFLAGVLRVSRRSIALVAGEKSRNKLITIEGLSAEELQARLSPYLV